MNSLRIDSPAVERYGMDSLYGYVHSHFEEHNFSESYKIRLVRGMEYAFISKA